MLLDVNSPLPNQALNRVAPWQSYTSEYLSRVFQVVENFKAFPNLLGFFSGNEVINEESVVEVPQYIRAVTRDIKDYIAAQATRAIPVGYSAADVRPMLANTEAYLTCSISSEPSSIIDLFGLNSYSWCGDATFEDSGFDVLVEDFKDIAIPIFFSEYGCNEVTPRTFSEVGTLYGDKMTGVFSGGIVYEYTQEANNYGLVEFNSDNTASLLVDFDNLQKQYEKLDFAKLQSGDASAQALTPPPCAAELITGATGNFSSNFTIPARPSGVDAMIKNGVKDPLTGKPVQITETAVGETVFESNGNEIPNLALQVLQDDQSNSPSTGNSSSSGSNGGGDGNSASRFSSGLMGSAGLLTAIMVLASVLGL
jgi:1,3-beta-glucanosyltransferase GAS3